MNRVREMAIFTVPNASPDRPVVETSQADLKARYGIERFEYPHATSQIRHIGFAPKTQQWYGWSHRAIAGFTVGSTVKKGDVLANPDNWPMQRGQRAFDVGFTARTLQDARDMAASFAEWVS